MVLVWEELLCEEESALPGSVMMITYSCLTRCTTSNLFFTFIWPKRSSRYSVPAGVEEFHNNFHQIMTQQNTILKGCIFLATNLTILAAAHNGKL